MNNLVWFDRERRHLESPIWDTKIVCNFYVGKPIELYCDHRLGGGAGQCASQRYHALLTRQEGVVAQVASARQTDLSLDALLDPRDS